MPPMATRSSDALIPYPRGEIVLRSRGSVVVYDPESKQLVVRDDKLDQAICPRCHRPFQDEVNGRPPPGHAAAPSPTATDFASTDYFRLLHHSLPGSAESSRPSSPSRRIPRVIAGRLGSSPAPAGAPEGADFVSSAPAPDSGPHGISAAAFSPDYFRRFFLEERELGRGGKGVVLLVKHVLDGVALGEFACKRIPVGDDHEWLRRTLVEVQLLQGLSHPNLVSYRHVWLEDVQITNFGPSVPCAFVLQQYCNLGDLQNYVYGDLKAGDADSAGQLKQRRRRLSKHEPEPPKAPGPRRLHFEEIYSLFKDIVSGLNHLHMNGYIHRDLKASNCLLHQTGKDLVCLVSDFGEVQKESQARVGTGATGTISYCAPEILGRNPDGRLGTFSTKSDIFSLGMVLYFMAFSRLPYRNANILNEENEDTDLLKAEISSWKGMEDHRNERPDLPDQLFQFLRRLLSLEPKQRPSTEEILHSLKTGARLDEPGHAPRAHSPAYDDTSESRISSLDTPPSKLSPSSPLSGLRPANVRKMTPPRNIKISSPLAREVPNSSSDDEQTPPTSANSTLVLRSPRSPMLELGPSATAQPTWSSHLPSLRTIKVFLFLGKVISLYLACFPSTMSQTVGLPVLAVASIDILTVDFGLSLSFILFVLHILAMGFAWEYDRMCLPRASFWEQVEN